MSYYRNYHLTVTGPKAERERFIAHCESATIREWACPDLEIGPDSVKVGLSFWRGYDHLIEEIAAAFPRLHMWGETYWAESQGADDDAGAFWVSINCGELTWTEQKGGRVHVE
jgi:hypothetical protein